MGPRERVGKHYHDIALFGGRGARKEGRKEGREDGRREESEDKDIYKDIFAY